MTTLTLQELTEREREARALDKACQDYIMTQIERERQHK